MATQEIIKILAAASAFICICFGILALFTGLKASGEIDLKGVFSGKLKTASAGVLLLFFGIILFSILIMKGESHKISVSEPNRSLDSFTVYSPDFENLSPEFERFLNSLPTNNSAMTGHTATNNSN